jgi:molybdopterin-guanine dinucleotide biosynthesis protein A
MNRAGSGRRSRGTALPPLFGLVLAGGRSTRMGTDKGSLVIRGVPQVVYLYWELRAVCRNVVISVAEPREDGMNATDAGRSGAYRGLPLIHDPTPSCGPIGGIAAAARYNPSAAWLIVACDLPEANRKTAGYLASYRHRRWDAVAYAADEGESGHELAGEPLFAVWEPAALRSAVKALKSGRYAVRPVLATHRVRVVEPPTTGTTTNLNTSSQLADYQSANSRIQEELHDTRTNQSGR